MSKDIYSIQRTLNEILDIAPEEYTITDSELFDCSDYPKSIDHYIPWNKGISGYKIQPHTEAHREKLSQALKGRKMSPERIAKQTGINNCNYGKKLGPRSEATKEKIRQARKKQVIVHSDETKRKIGDAHRGSKRTAETKKKMSEAAKGRIPWNKGKKGVQVAWNKGLKKSSTSLT